MWGFLPAPLPHRILNLAYGLAASEWSSCERCLEQHHLLCRAESSYARDVLLRHGPPYPGLLPLLPSPAPMTQHFLYQRVARVHQDWAALLVLQMPSMHSPQTRISSLGPHLTSSAGSLLRSYPGRMVLHPTAMSASPPAWMIFWAHRALVFFWTLLQLHQAVIRAWPRRTPEDLDLRGWVASPPLGGSLDQSEGTSEDRMRVEMTDFRVEIRLLRRLILVCRAAHHFLSLVLVRYQAPVQQILRLTTRWPFPWTTPAASTVPLLFSAFPRLRRHERWPVPGGWAVCHWTVAHDPLVLLVTGRQFSAHLRWQTPVAELGPRF